MSAHKPGKEILKVLRAAAQRGGGVLTMGEVEALEEIARRCAFNERRWQDCAADYAEERSQRQRLEQEIGRLYDRLQEAHERWGIDV
jgi:hypothetical protein